MSGCAVTVSVEWGGARNDSLPPLRRLAVDRGSVWGYLRW